MTHARHYKIIVVLLLLAAVTGCGLGPDPGELKPANHLLHNGFGVSPRIRFGSYPSSNVGTTYLDKNLGTHGYIYKAAEKDGIVYTCRAGHIDIIHLRIAADWTAYLTAKTFKTLTTDDDGFSYKLAVDRSRYFVRFSYPENWKNLSKQQKETIAAEVSSHVGQYLTFTTTTWHEILTWFGFKCIGVFPEYPSAFSWEESFSNLLGTRLAAQAMKDTDHSYDQAMTIAIDNELEKLGVQSVSVARYAADSVKGKWFTGSVLFLVDMRRRNFDIGLKDGLVTPTLVPDIAECKDAKPVSYPAPNTDILAKYGLSVTLEIEPHEWESGRILDVVYGKDRKSRVVPRQHLPIIMDYIEKDAVKKGYICDFN